MITTARAAWHAAKDVYVAAWCTFNDACDVTAAWDVYVAARDVYVAAFLAARDANVTSAWDVYDVARAALDAQP